MVKYDEDARVYADLIRDKNRLKAQIANAATLTHQIKKDDNCRIIIKDWMPVMRIRTLGDVWIWDHPNQALWDISNWDSSGSAYGRWIDWMRRRWEWKRKQDFRQVVETAIISGAATELNATHNLYYMRPQRVE